MDQGAKNFDFNINSNFAGYDSTRDKTNIAENYLVRGSQNVYKKLSGTIAVRQGQKQYGPIQTALSAFSSEFVWNTSWGATYILAVGNNKLQVLSEGVYYDLLTGLTATRYVFDKWWDNTEKKDRVLFVHGNSDMQHWSGGIATIASGTAPVAGTVTGIAINTGGGSYEIGQIITITGGGGTGATYRITSVAPGTLAVTGLSQITGGTGYSTGTNLATTVNTGGGTLFTVDITSVATTGTLTKQGTTSWQQAGFASNLASEKKIMILGVEYTYIGGEDTATLYGVLPDPSGILAGTVAIQSVLTQVDTPAAGFNNDFIKVINNQVYVGSYTSRLCYISSSTNFADYVVPTPRAAGDPELLTLDATLKGIGVRQGNAHIGFGNGSWAVITFNDITVGSTLTQQTKVDVKPVAQLQAPYAHEFIDTVGDSLVYLAQDQQVRMFGDFTNLFTPGYPSLSQEISTELMEQNFAEGSLRCIGEFTYLCAPITGKVWLYQVRQAVDQSGQVVAERLWHSPFVWNLTSVNQVNGTIVGFSNANPQIYSLWDTNQWYDDSPSTEHLPYECVAAFSYRGGKRRQGLWSFDKNFTEGYIAPGTPLSVRINYNYQGSLAVLNATINSITQPAYTFSGATAPSLGDRSPGEEPLGDGFTTLADAQEALPKFKVINSMNQQNCFEWQPIYYSEATNAQWELLAVGDNAQLEADQKATFIINKLRQS